MKIGPRPGGQAPPRWPNCYFFPIKNIIGLVSPQVGMAKNTFFIRGSVTAPSGGGYAQAEIDLGSYTNLGSSKPELLRIHNISVAMTDAAGEVPVVDSNTAVSTAWQITTQTQSAIVLITDDSVVAAGRAALRNPDGSSAPPSQAFESQMLPQDFTGGYLVAVPTLFLGALGTAEFEEGQIYSFMLECTTESISKSNAVALAVSQQ